MYIDKSRKVNLNSMIENDFIINFDGKLIVSFLQSSF